MMIEIAFGCYFLCLLVYDIAININYYRIKDRCGFFPEMVTFLLPFVVNFIVSNTIFDDINNFLSTLVPILMTYVIGRVLKKVRIIGLTDSIGCGRQQLCKYLSDRMHFPIIHSHSIQTQLLKKGHPGYTIITRMLQAEYGSNYQQFLDPLTGELTHDALYNKVMRNPHLRQQFNAQIHKHILIAMIKAIIGNLLNHNYVMIIDSPELLSSQMMRYLCYPIILVGCSPQTQLDNLIQLHHYSPQEALHLQSEAPIQLHKAKANIYLHNECPQELFNQCAAKLNPYLTRKPFR